MAWIGYQWLGFGASRSRKPCCPCRTGVPGLSSLVPARLLILAIWVVVWGAGGLSAAEQPEKRPASRTADSEWIEGKVTAIVDGDTFRLVAKGAEYLVDLAGIDAPEKGQRSGGLAAQVLYLKVLEKEVRVLVFPPSEPNGIVQAVSPVPVRAGSGFAGARCRRVCGIVYAEGCVNGALVREGVAWHDSGRCPSSALAAAEVFARTERRGLWQGDVEPIPPWQWRRERLSRARDADAPAREPEVPDFSRLFEAQTPGAAVEAAAQVRPIATRTPLASPGVTDGARPVATGKYWLTTSSGIRHNSKCRYYKKSKGRPCGAGEGRPCLKCGG